MLSYFPKNERQIPTVKFALEIAANGIEEGGHSIRLSKLRDCRQVSPEAPLLTST
jgi:hypothetical protein